MRPRTEAILAVALLATLVALAAAVGASRRDAAAEDLRASSFFSGPLGARGLADALRRSGVTVSASRRRLDELEHDTSRNGRRLIMLLDPADPMSGAEQTLFLDWFASAPASDLLLAGSGASRLMGCFGHLVDRRPLESVTLLPIAGQESANAEWPKVSAVLSASTRSVIIDSSRTEDAGITSCTVPAISRIDTLLTSQAGRVVAQRLWLEGRDQRIVLIADAALARNRALRETPAGPFLLGLITREYQQVVFDELHQGFGQGGSLLKALLGWSRRSPWGWAVWQLAVVGLLLLAVGAIRFGPVRHVIVRRRRSPLEHVRALATALAAARGHDVAIGAIVRGLQRRLHPASRQGRTEWRAWVERLTAQLRSPRAQEAARTLQSLTRPGQPSEGVLQAANAVEDVWQELRP
jgi:hypothetical protein